MKKVWIILIIIVVLFVGFLGYLYHSLTSSKTVSAQLIVDEGTVRLNGATVTGIKELALNDIITTEEGKATVILLESVVINLEQQTEVKLTDLLEQHPQVEQIKGKTWNTFTKLGGVKEYSIKEGNSVASVRATTFLLEHGKIIIGKGTVSYIIDGKEYLVTKDKVVEDVDGAIIERDATPEELELMKVFTRKSITSLKTLRQLEVQKHSGLVNTLKEKYGVSDQEILDTLEQVDRGEKDVDEMVEQSPVKIESLYKIAEISKVIQELNK